MDASTWFQSAASRREVKQEPVARNPWGLTLREGDAMDALCERGQMRQAAIRLHISYHTLNTYTKSAYQKLGAHNMVKACLMWDRWRQTDGKGVPA